MLYKAKRTTRDAARTSVSDRFVVEFTPIEYPTQLIEEALDALIRRNERCEPGCRSVCFVFETLHDIEYICHFCISFLYDGADFIEVYPSRHHVSASIELEEASVR